MPSFFRKFLAKLKMLGLEVLLHDKYVDNITVEYSPSEMDGTLTETRQGCMMKTYSVTCRLMTRP